MSEELTSSSPFSGKSSVIYLGRIPREFEEEEMRKFFTQFGKIKRLRLSRNKKTGASKHYAFIEFETPEVADIVASTMNNYILFGHKLSCSLMDPNNIHPTLWKGANKKFIVPRSPRSFVKKVRSKEEVEGLLRKRLEKNQSHLEKIKELGLEYPYLVQQIAEDQKSLGIVPEKKETVVKAAKTAKTAKPAEVQEEKKAGRVVKRLSKQTKKLGK